jgi:hypothetical protein
VNLCVLCESENKQRLFLYTALIDSSETECVYCAVRTGCLYIIQVNFVFKDLRQKRGLKNTQKLDFLLAIYFLQGNEMRGILRHGNLQRSVLHTLQGSTRNFSAQILVSSAAYIIHRQRQGDVLEEQVLCHVQWPVFDLTSHSHTKQWHSHQPRVNLWRRTPCSPPQYAKELT